MAEKLKIISLGGLNEIGKNMTVLEYGKDMIVIDCGIAFPEEDMYGIDLVIPDVTYLAQNAKKLRGFFITHGHEDHIGSLPYVLQAVNAPVHGTRLTNGLIALKLEEHNLRDKVKLITHTPGEVVRAGCFSVEFIHVNHSIADAVAFAITTPVGTIVMTGDFKIDPTASEGMMDLTRLGELGKQGVLALLCDSTNVERQGYTPSEMSVADNLDRQFKNCDQRIIITTFASNLHRLQSVLQTAHRYGRKVAITGRSMENMIRVAAELDYIKAPDDTLIDLCQIKNLPKNKVVVVSTGSQGESMSALYRMAYSNHRQVDIQAGDRIIISAAAIPGNEKAVSRIINELYRKGAEVVYDKEEGLHASGHACQEELKIIHALTMPKYFIPVHGEQRHLRKHAQLAKMMGMTPKRILVADVGQVIECTSKTCKLTDATVTSGCIFVDGNGVGDVGAVVLRERKHLAEDGVIVVSILLNADDGSLLAAPELLTRGFVHVKENADLLEAMQMICMESLDNCQYRHIRDWDTIKGTLKGNLSAYVYKNTRRNPMIIPVVTEI